MIMCIGVKFMHLVDSKYLHMYWLKIYTGFDCLHDNSYGKFTECDGNCEVEQEDYYPCRGERVCVKYDIDCIVKRFPQSCRSSSR